MEACPASRVNSKTQLEPVRRQARSACTESEQEAEPPRPTSQLPRAMIERSEHRPVAVLARWHIRADSERALAFQVGGQYVARQLQVAVVQRVEQLPMALVRDMPVAM